MRSTDYHPQITQIQIRAGQTHSKPAPGLATCVPLETNVQAIRELVDDVCLVSEDELLNAIRVVLLQEHVVAGAAAAAGVAAYLQNWSAYADLSVVLLVTGSNVLREILLRAMAL